MLGPPFLAGAPFLIDGMRFALRGHHPQLGWLLDGSDANTFGLSEGKIRGLRARSRLRLPGEGAGWLTPDPLLSREQRLGRVGDLPGWHLHATDRYRLGAQDRQILRDPHGGAAAGRIWLLTASDPNTGAVVATKVEIEGELADAEARAAG